MPLPPLSSVPIHETRSQQGWEGGRGERVVYVPSTFCRFVESGGRFLTGVGGFAVVLTPGELRVVGWYHANMSCSTGMFSCATSSRDCKSQRRRVRRCRWTHGQPSFPSTRSNSSRPTTTSVAERLRVALGIARDASDTVATGTPIVASWSSEAES